MKAAIGRFAVRHAISIVFLVLALCLGGGYAARKMGSSVFPETDFPRVVIMADNGVMPADEMMATVTRPIEEAMKDILGSETIRSTTGRGTAQIDLFFSWKVNMRETELYVLSRLAQIRHTLPATAQTEVYRMNFSTFPIIGISLTSPGRDISSLWELARYELKPKFLRIPGVARVELVGDIDRVADHGDALRFGHDLRQALDLARRDDARDVAVAVLAHEDAAVARDVQQVVRPVEPCCQQDDGIARRDRGRP